MGSQSNWILASTMTICLLGVVACSDPSTPPQSTAPPALIPNDGNASASTGQVDFRVACAPAAVEPFNQALGLMHHMMYVEARSAFEMLASLHPDCAMAHWGVATSMFQPLWPTRPSSADLEWGLALMIRAQELGTGSDRDQALLDATTAFYQPAGELDWWNRIGRWGAALAEAHSRFANDPDVAAMHALSKLALADVAEDPSAVRTEAAGILLDVLAKHPQHPGAVHYTIHANDADGREHESPDVVRSYSAISPEVPHALHMPTHVFVRQGIWPDVIELNLRSAEAALRYPAGDRISHHFIHAIDYAVYAHLQLGDDTQARQLYKRALAAGALQQSFVSAFHMASIPARLAVERRAWEEALLIEPRTPVDLPWDSALWPEGIAWAARGLGAVYTQDTKEADVALERLGALRDKANEAGERAFAEYIEVDRLIVSGFRSYVAGDVESALGQLRAASALESRTAKHPVTPGSVLPADEALGDLLMMLKQPEQALSAYVSSDARWPGRYNTLLGAARAAVAANRPELAKNYYAKLVAAANSSSRPGIAEARAWLDQASATAKP